MDPVLLARRTLRRLPGWDGATRRRWAVARLLADRRDGIVPARRRRTEDLPVTVYRHASPLVRGGTTMADPLVRGKVRNLTRVVEHLDGLLLGPGEVFSFWTAVGPPLRRRGFVPGPVLGDGRLGAGDGGGICAAANLLRWLVLHAELDVVECSEHSVDPFPDDARTVPWGTGATVSWPRQDLRIVVRDQVTYQWRLELADGFLHGRLLAERVPRYAYVVHERDAGFQLVDGVPWRRNEIWRTAHEVGTGRPGASTLLFRNRARTAYPPPVLGPVPVLPAEPLTFPSPRQ